MSPPFFLCILGCSKPGGVIVSAGILGLLSLVLVVFDFSIFSHVLLAFDFTQSLALSTASSIGLLLFFSF